jgi:mRNA interferase MazF
MKRGEVWEINLDPTMGAEIRKKRPCVIVSRDSLGALPMRVIVPLTEWQPRFASAPWHVCVEKARKNGLAKRSSADTVQLRSVSVDRLVRRIGTLDDTTMERISAALVLVIAPTEGNNG